MPRKADLAHLFLNHQPRDNDHSAICLPIDKPAIRLVGKSQGRQTIPEYEE